MYWQRWGVLVLAAIVTLATVDLVNLLKQYSDGIETVRTVSGSTTFAENCKLLGLAFKNETSPTKGACFMQ